MVSGNGRGLRKRFRAETSRLMQQRPADEAVEAQQTAGYFWKHNSKEEPSDGYALIAVGRASVRLVSLIRSHDRAVLCLKC